MDTLTYKVCYQIEKDYTWRMPFQRDFSMRIPDIAVEIRLFNRIGLRRFVVETPEDALNHLIRQIRNRSLKWHDEIRV